MQCAALLLTWLLDRRMGVRQAHDACGASAQTPTRLGPNPARAGSRACEAGEPGEKAGTGYQEECQKWPDWSVQNTG